MDQTGQNETLPAPLIIPVASGKGGVGKSLFAANLALSLAASGNRVVAVDLDLGGSNLHSCLGLGNTHAGIGDFINASDLTLEEIIVSTPFSNLGFLPGDGVTPFLANLGYFQKLKLIRSLKALDVDYIVADLGAGSSFNTLDFFAMSTRGIIVATPDTMSLLNAMTFLKHFVLRQVGQIIRGDHRLKEIIDRQKHQGLRIPAGSVTELVKQIEEIDKTAAREVTDRLQTLRPRLVMNQVDSAEDLNLLQPVEHNLLDKLSLPVESFGVIPFDANVRRLVRDRGVLLKDLPESLVSQGVQRIAGRVERLWNRNLESSLERLLIDTRGWLHDEPAESLDENSETHGEAELEA